MIKCRGKLDIFLPLSVFKGFWMCVFICAWREKIGDKEVSVAVTPNGYADAVLGSKFVMPEERHMAFSKFLDIIECKVTANGIFYVQKQNSSLKLEFEELIPDLEEHIPWATEAFGMTFKLPILLVPLTILWNLCMIN